MRVPSLTWLPEINEWRPRLRALLGSTSDAWPELVALANARLDFVRTNALDEMARRCFADAPPKNTGTKPVRLAILSSCTVTHLHAGIRVAGLRRGIWIESFESDYGQYLQNLLDPQSALHGFKPDAILFGFDARHLTQGVHASMSAEDAEAEFGDVTSRIAQCWDLAKREFGCAVYQQSVIDCFAPLLGNNEFRLPGSKAGFVTRLNHWMRDQADAHGVDMVAIDRAIAQDGLAAWYDAALWDRSKQEITPAASPMYGELVARLIAARQGRSYKCLVLDLDNTLWGGVIGDDGMDGIAIGQGSPLGEGFVALQNYAKDLARRGIILAVCTKNDEANALEPFEKHPDMVLRRTDIACFRANWDDKASNIRAIAAELNIGIDSLVFLDDNPFERNLVRGELPMVAVPEWNDEPSLVPHILAAAGYFESLGITGEDRLRTAQYQENVQREKFRHEVTDMEGYLRGLNMQMVWKRFDSLGQSRVVQLINKTNQFNLTTRRYTDDDVQTIMDDPKSFGLQLRLLDRFGDNGIIAIIIGRMQNETELLIDTWLMSCRVLGRGVETTTLNLIASHAKALGAHRLIGEFIATKKNGMVRDHYTKLGFSESSRAEDGHSFANLELADFVPPTTFIDVTEG